MAKSYNLGNIHFPVQYEAEEYFKRMIKVHENRPRLEPEEEAVVRDLLRLHSDYHKFEEIGIEYIFVQRNFLYPTGYWFVVKSKDRSENGFSYHHCLRSKTHQQKVIEAFRYSVVEDIFEARDRAFANGSAVCPATGEVLSRGSCEVDHVYPRTLRFLMDMFLLDEGIDKEKSEKSVLLARNKYLEKHVDQEVIRKLTTMVDNEVKLKTWVADKKK